MSKFLKISSRIFLPILLSCISLALPAIAQATDTSSGWQGFYVGGHVARTNVDYSIFGADNPNATTNGGHPFDQPGGTFYALDLQETNGGFQVGYNRLYNNLLLGIEVDYTAINKRKEVLYDLTGVRDYVDLKINSSLSLSGRLAYPIGRFLPYIKGGITRMNVEVDAGDIRDSVLARDFSDQTTLREKDTSFSYAVGLEYLLHQDWALKFEYMRVNMGEFQTSNQDANGETFFHDFEKIEFIKLGVNYIF